MSDKKTKKKPPDKCVKLRLRTNTEAVKHWLLGSVDAISHVAVHLSRFANMYVLHCCENNLTLPEIDQTFFNRIMQLLTKSVKKRTFADQQMKYAFDTLYKPLLRGQMPQRTADHKQFLEQLSREMQTNTKVYLKTQFITRFRAWCKDFIMTLVPLNDDDLQIAEKKKQRWKLVSYLFQETAKSDSRIVDIATIQREVCEKLQVDCQLIWSDIVANQMAVAISVTRNELNLEITIEKKKHKVVTEEQVFCRPITGSKLLRTDLNCCYLKWMYKRLVELETHNNIHVHSNDNNETKPKRKGSSNTNQKKVFSMLPIRSLDRPYISVSSTALKEWIYRHRKNRDVVGSEICKRIKQMKHVPFLKYFDENQLWFWQQCFDFDNALRSNYKFHYQIVTDGYACSIAIKKSTEKMQTVKENDRQVITLQDDERENDRKIRVFTADELEQSDIVGVDPGRIKLHTSVVQEENGHYKVTTYSNGRWQQECGGRRAKRNREKWAKARGEEYNEWQKKMPSTKVATVEAMQKHVKHLMLHLKECFEENGKMQVRKQKFTGYVMKQKALRRMVDEFIEQTEKKKLIVSFGDAAFKTSGPTKKMKVELKRRKNVTVVDMDEFHTSLMMTCCAFADENAKAVERVGPVVTHTDKDGKAFDERLYGVSCCKNCTCYWNRDVNAAVNMLQLFLHAQKHNGKRHEFFSRQVATSAKQKRTAAAKKRKNNTKDAMQKLRKHEGSNNLHNISGVEQPFILGE